MSREPVTPERARRAVAVAVVLLLALVFAASNFVLVDVRLFGAGFEARLAWAILVPAALAFAAGVWWGRRRR